MCRRDSVIIGPGFAIVVAGLGVTWLLSVTAAADFDQPPVRQADVPAAMDLPSGQGSGTVRTRCLGCHGADLISQQRLSRAAWDREVAKMIGWGANVEGSETRDIVDYLAVHFGLDEPTTVSADATDSAAALVTTRCTACHGVALIEAQRLAVDGWTREVDKMTSWGATLAAPEKDLLVRYLARRFGRYRDIR